MANFTLADVRQAAASAVGTALVEGALGDQVIASRADTYFEARASEAVRIPAKHFDIFLSHAYKDKVIVTGLYSILTTSGFSVYVDWIQDRHRLDRTKVTAGNAAILRERMRQCSSLFYATTDNYKDSRWMSWECGYFDGYDGKPLYDGVQAGHVAILPVLQSATETFNGVEYLGLYPVAQKGNWPRRNVNIHNQQAPAKYFHFDQWIKNGHP
jgi:hypothetical protein